MTKTNKDYLKEIISDKLHKLFLELKAKDFLLNETINDKTYDDFIRIDNIKRSLIPLWVVGKDHNKSAFILKKEFENLLYEFMFQYELPKSKPIYHYTTLNNLHSIIKGDSIRLSAIAGLNDKAELNDNLNFSDEKLSTEDKEDIAQEVNERYVLSCSAKCDHLNSWRLYGDDGRGAIIEFSLQNRYLSNDYQLLLGRVIYGNEFMTLLRNTIVDLSKNEKVSFYPLRLSLWKNFLKVEDFKEEAEIRLIMIYENEKEARRNTQWTINSFGILNSYEEFEFQEQLIPLKIVRIILGPKCPEGELNQSQLKYLLKHLRKDEIIVERSKINHYR